MRLRRFAPPSKSLAAYGGSQIRKRLDDMPKERDGGEMKLLCLFATIALGLGLTAAVVWGAVGALNAASEVDWDYKGITYVSWTRGDYPWTTSWKAQEKRWS